MGPSSPGDNHSVPRIALRGENREEQSMSETHETEATHDHMGRKIVDTKGAAFQQDLPWIIATVALTVFTIMALAGYFRL